MKAASSLPRRSQMEVTISDRRKVVGYGAYTQRALFELVTDVRVVIPLDFLSPSFLGS